MPAHTQQTAEPPRDNEVKVKAAEPPSAPAPCRSGVRGRSAPAAGGNLRAERPAHKPNRRFGRGARTVCCANAQKDRAPEGARLPQSATLTARILTRVRGSGQSLGRNYKAAKPPSAPAPCRSGVRGRSAPAAGGNLRAERPAHKPNRRFGRGARTVCCANAQKDRAPEGVCFPLSATLTAHILTRFAAPVNHGWSELQRGRPFDRSAAFAASLTPGEAPQLRCGFLR